MYEGKCGILLGPVSFAFTGFLQPVLAPDETGKGKIEAWRGRQTGVHADQMELRL